MLGMRHPLQYVQPGQEKKIFLSALALYLVLQALFVYLDAPLRTTAAPNGIVSFELAASPNTARAIVESWNEYARLDASFGLGIDYLFMFAYSTTIALACLWSARVLRERGWPVEGLGVVAAWGIWFAALFDAAENAVLLSELFGSVSDALSQLAAICATLKFTLIAACLFYLGYGVAAWLGRRWAIAGH